MIKIVGEIEIQILPHEITGEEPAKTIVAYVHIETNLDGRITPNTLKGYSSPFKGRDDESIYRMEAYVNLFEVLRILGFPKTMIVNAIPEKYRPTFRRELAKIRANGAR